MTRTIVIDGHADLAADAAGRHTFPLADAIAGGVDAVVVPAHAGLVPRRADPAEYAAELEATYQAVLETAANSGGQAKVAASPEDVERHAAAGVFSLILGFQNARPLAGLDELAQWLDRGVSVFDFGFIGSNQWAESARPYPYAYDPVDGLSELGRAAVKLLNERGVVIDTAQVSPAARAQILEASTAPVIASHNGLKAKVGETDRTLSDDEVKAIAEAGGLVQIVAFDGYHTARGLDPVTVAGVKALRERFGLPGQYAQSDYYMLLDAETADWDAERFAEYFHEYHAYARHGWPKTDVARFADSIDHVVQLAGVDHVGVASDFHHGGGIAGWLDYTQTPNVTAELARRYSAADVAKIWGGNLLRVWGEARRT